MKSKMQTIILLISLCNRGSNFLPSFLVFSGSPHVSPCCMTGSNRTGQAANQGANKTQAKRKAAPPPGGRPAAIADAQVDHVDDEPLIESPRVKQEPALKRIRRRAVPGQPGGASCSSTDLFCGICEASSKKCEFSTNGPVEADGSRGPPGCRDCFEAWRAGWAHKCTWTSICSQHKSSTDIMNEFDVSRDVLTGVRKKDTSSWWKRVVQV